jgi:hypothetical protein
LKLFDALFLNYEKLNFWLNNLFLLVAKVCN